MYADSRDASSGFSKLKGEAWGPTKMVVQVISVDKSLVELYVENTEDPQKSHSVRFVMQTGLVKGEIYHNGWWIPVPVSVGDRIRLERGHEFAVRSLDDLEIHGTMIPAARLEGSYSERSEYSTEIKKSNYWYSAVSGILLQRRSESVSRYRDRSQAHLNSSWVSTMEIDYSP